MVKLTAAIVPRSGAGEHFARQAICWEPHGVFQWVPGRWSCTNCCNPQTNPSSAHHPPHPPQRRSRRTQRCRACASWPTADRALAGARSMQAFFRWLRPRWSVHNKPLGSSSGSSECSNTTYRAWPVVQDGVQLLNEVVIGLQFLKPVVRIGDVPESCTLSLHTHGITTVSSSESLLPSSVHRVQEGAAPEWFTHMSYQAHHHSHHAAQA